MTEKAYFVFAAILILIIGIFIGVIIAQIYIVPKPIIMACVNSTIFPSTTLVFR